MLITSLPRAALADLSAIGEVYTTIDDDHFCTTKGPTHRVSNPVKDSGMNKTFKPGRLWLDIFF